MKKLIMSIAVFTATYLLLSIELSGGTLFSHLYSVTAPLTKSAQRMVEAALGKSVDETKSVSKQLFNNTLPQAEKAKALVPQKLKAPEENLSEAEKAELNSLIKTYSR